MTTEPDFNDFYPDYSSEEDPNAPPPEEEIFPPDPDYPDDSWPDDEPEEKENRFAAEQA